ncbi:heavy metal translocating P-type ATPase, partial [Eubacteriales bacterium DFI.9.88]|nr:heavy metal translocating P-type ATPase [Eubacteriales bacterium DFI.9.88]
LLQTEEFEAIHGKGIKAVIDGKTYFAGNEKLIKSQAGGYGDQVEKTAAQLSDQGKTPLIFADDKTVIGIIAVSDMEKAISRKAIQLFKDMKIKVVM